MANFDHIEEKHLLNSGSTNSGPLHPPQSTAPPPDAATDSGPRGRAARQVVIAGEAMYPMPQVAALIGLSENRLRDLSRKAGLLTHHGSRNYLTPTNLVSLLRQQPVMEKSPPPWMAEFLGAILDGTAMRGSLMSKLLMMERAKWSSGAVDKLISQNRLHPFSFRNGNHLYYFAEIEGIRAHATE